MNLRTALTLIVVLGGAATARAEVCRYAVATGWGFCPADAGETICLRTGHDTCTERLRCLGVGPLCFDFTLAPQSGPAAGCPPDAALVTELRCTPMLNGPALKGRVDRVAAEPSS